MKNFQELYDQKFTDTEIADATNTPYHKVGIWRRENNLKVNKLIDKYSEDIKRYVSEGLTNKAISRLIPVSSPHIYKMRRELSIAASPYKRSVFLNEEERTKATIITRSRSRANQKGMEFTITTDDIDLVKVCPYLGIELVYLGSFSKNSASIDRIDSSKGYIPGNVMMISSLANTMKSNSSKEELLLFCKNAPNVLK